MHESLDSSSHEAHLREEATVTERLQEILVNPDVAAAVASAMRMQGIWR